MTLALALILDAIFGEPRWLWARLPHPAVMIGTLISALTRRFNRGGARRAKGFVLIFILIGIAWVVGVFLSFLGPMAEVICAAILLAHKSLIEHVKRVANGLRFSLPQGRRDVAMIVGRDTAQMTAPQVARGAIESAAENFSDGFVAPAFWFFIAGLPGILIYKAINTADSMVGYKNQEFGEFGFASAKLDDLVNWIPARLTALLILLTAGSVGALKSVQKDAVLHRSPNAGWPEAAMANCLNISLAGPRSYDGKLQDFAWVNPKGDKSPTPATIDASTSVLWRAWVGVLVLVVIAAVF